MPLIIKSNTASQQAVIQLNRANRALYQNMASMSSGLRITRAADDAAGLAVAENLESKAMSSRQAARNINDGMSMIGVYESAIDEAVSLFKRQRELGVQGASETLDTTQRAHLEDENTAIKLELNRLAMVTKFNGQGLADGTPTDPSYPDKTFKHFDVQIGTENSANDRIKLTFSSLYSSYMVYNSSAINYAVWGNVSSAYGARNTIQGADAALEYLGKARSTIGASQNRLTSALNNIEAFTATTETAQSNIRDADFAAETAELSKLQVMQQARVAILGQANGVNAGALRLL